MMFGTTIVVLLLQLGIITTSLPTEQQPLQDVIPNSLLNVRAQLRKAEIIPTVIDDFLPSISLTITWSKHQNASLGNTIPPKKLQSQPSLTLYDETNPDGCATTNMTYVVAMTDPDAPSRDDPKWSEMCHWIVGNVSLSQRGVVSILPFPLFEVEEELGLEVKGAAKDEELDEVMEYKPPGPPPKTGKHRYVFLVFAPRNSTTLPLDLTKPKDRQHWGTGEERKGVRQWAEDNGLVPVGANFIYSQNKKQ